MPEADLRAQGLDPYSDGWVLVRSKRQRRHDALKLILRKVLGADLLGERGKTPVTMSITVSAETLHGVPGATPATGSAGQTLAASLVRRLACELPTTRRHPASRQALGPPQDDKPDRHRAAVRKQPHRPAPRPHVRLKNGRSINEAGWAD